MHDILKNAVKIAAVLVIVSCFNLYCSAADNQKGLTLSPIKTEINIHPGTVKTGTLKVSNFTANQMQVSLDSEAFSVINRQYDYKFTVESNAAKWVVFETQSITLSAGETREVSYSLNVPVSAEPGGQYFSIFASTDTAATDSAVSSKQRIASLLYITVMGDVTKTGRLLYLNSPWLVSGNNMWSMSIQNTGTAHFRSKYNLKVSDFFGNKISNSNESESLILPATVREVSELIPLPQFPGIYKLTFDISLGDSSSKIETRYMIYSPVWFSIVVIITIFIITVIIVGKKKKAKN